jgi:hypothetical protein
MRQVVVLFSHQRVADQQDVKIKLSPEVFIRHPAEEPQRPIGEKTVLFLTL